MEITVVSTVGALFFIVVAALAVIFFKKHSKSSEKCSCFFFGSLFSAVQNSNSTWSFLQG